MMKNPGLQTGALFITTKKGRPFRAPLYVELFLLTAAGYSTNENRKFKGSFTNIGFWSIAWAQVKSRIIPMAFIRTATASPMCIVQTRTIINWYPFLMLIWSSRRHGSIIESRRRQTVCHFGTFGTGGHFKIFYCNLVNFIARSSTTTRGSRPINISTSSSVRRVIFAKEHTLCIPITSICS